MPCMVYTLILLFFPLSSSFITRTCGRGSGRLKEFQISCPSFLKGQAGLLESQDWETLLIYPRWETRFFFFLLHYILLYSDKMVDRNELDMYFKYVNQIPTFLGNLKLNEITFHYWNYIEIIFNSYTTTKVWGQFFFFFYEYFYSAIMHEKTFTLFQTFHKKY